MKRWTEAPGLVRPMLATLSTDVPLVQPALVYEPKYDGIRAIVHVGASAGDVRLWSRLGNEKTSQFPSIIRALSAAARKLGGPLLVDGEIVALDADGRPAGFQRLQGRIHLSDARDVERVDQAQSVALIAFDLLRERDEDLRGLPLTERRARLERRFVKVLSEVLRVSEQALGDGRALQQRARREGWEGLIAKEARAPYQSGRRSPAWRKIKLLRQEEFVVGGWTEPRQTRQYFGALLLGVFEGGALRYVGHTGTGFDQAELARVWAMLKARETDRSPFSERIRTNEPAHWVCPELVAQVRFTEWTDDHKLRHPVYLGLRDDKLAREVLVGPQAAERSEADRPKAAAPKARKARGGGAPRAVREAAESLGAPVSVYEQLKDLEHARRDGTIDLPGGQRLGVTNLHKVFWPGPKLTKGDLLRYYAEVAPLILPAVEGRPLVMKRFPNGITGQAFYQHKSRLEQPPAGVRVERIDGERFVGGSLITLLYMTQLAAISQDPWFSRVESPLEADYVALDLDPGDDTPFSRVVDVARWVRDELHSLKVPAVLKTSGSRGLHVYIPLPRGTSYESGMLFCQIVATVIASRHPKAATVERSVRARGRGTVYIDYLQNIRGKTLATAYSARASEFAGVSTPLRWEELDAPLDPREFTIVTAPARFRDTGDLWARLRTAPPADLNAVFRKYGSR